MDSIGKRLRWARARAKLERRDVVDRTRIPYSTYSDYENERRDPSRDNAIALGRLFKVPWEWILEGPAKPPPDPKTEPPTPMVRGLIGAGNAVEPSDDLDEPIELPPATAIGVKVRGNSMYPRYKDGEKLVYLPEEHSPEELIGRECAVKIKDGGVVVKTIRRGSRKNRFHLESYNAPLLEDVAIEWASPIRWRAD